MKRLDNLIRRQRHHLYAAFIFVVGIPAGATHPILIWVVWLLGYMFWLSFNPGKSHDNF